jgi:hypothetical protein
MQSIKRPKSLRNWISMRSRFATRRTPTKAKQPARMWHQNQNWQQGSMDVQPTWKMLSPHFYAPAGRWKLEHWSDQRDCSIEYVTTTHNEQIDYSHCCKDNPNKKCPKCVSQVKLWNSVLRRGRHCRWLKKFTSSTRFTALYTPAQSHGICAVRES